MKCPKCSFEQPDDTTECMRCGIVYEKYLKYYDAALVGKELPVTDEKDVSNFRNLVKNLLLYVPDEINPFIFYTRVLFFLIFFIWGLKFIFSPLEANYAGYSFWHLVNLPFHEAGHIFFRPLGRLMTSLGGSIGQLLMPLICLIVFVVKTKDTFAASFSLWWFAENWMDMAPYMNDARSLSMPLLGGNTGPSSPYGFHDWEYILNELGMLRYDHTVASISHNIGITLMIASFIWGGYLLFKQYKISAGQPVKGFGPNR
ncbi:MAG: zinc ribbon domain-containing protein [Desulfobacterales bacterium]|nr:zinc ribbon domain-containing protein [Desulfobacterales bacterium]MDD4072090.1 zinc ribbon domain-containing protein [Desulfobacterales bacterium]MDD4393485.1 zinc ribbon domain-containing protein [Desulfobacterales bacterium]